MNTVTIFPGALGCMCLRKGGRLYVMRLNPKHLYQYEMEKEYCHQGGVQAVNIYTGMVDDYDQGER